MARLKGVSVARVITVHALPNALPPIINMVVLLIANYMVGAFIVEQIFSYPGIGKMMMLLSNSETFRWCWPSASSLRFSSLP